MSQDLQKLLKEALLNNSYDYDAMHKSLKNTWMNSFSYLYDMQKQYIGYEELFYYSDDEESRNISHIGHLYLDKMIYANFDVDYDLIHVHDREEYRTSRFYEKRFTITDVMMNPHIFLKIPVVIIDDQVIWDYQIQIKEDYATFTLPFRRNFVLEDERNPETDEVIYIEHKVQVLVIDNIFYQRMKVNKTSIGFNAISKQITITPSVINQFIEPEVREYVTDEWLKKFQVSNVSLLPSGQEDQMNKMVEKKIKKHSIPFQDGTMMCSIHIPNAIGKQYELGTALITLERDENGNYVGNLTDVINTLIHQSSTNFYVSLIFFNRLYSHTFYTGKKTTIVNDNLETDIMVVQESELVPYKTPIPVENFMVFKKSSDGYILEKNADMLSMHYPNIYLLKDKNMQVGDEYQIFYFYNNAYDLKYTVLFDFYFRFLYEKFAGCNKGVLNSWKEDILGGQDIMIYEETIIESDESNGSFYLIKTSSDYLLYGNCKVTIRSKYTTREKYTKKLGSVIEHPPRTTQLHPISEFGRVFVSTSDQINVTTTIPVFDTSDIESIEQYENRGKRSLEEVINDIYYNRYDLSEYSEQEKKDIKETFQKIIDYSYYNHEYGEMDFLTRYTTIPNNIGKEVIEYKDETLKNWIKVEPWVLRDYVLDQKKLGSSYHLFTNTIDLKSRLRTDTSVEFGRPTTKFNEDRYVFAFANERDYPTLLDCRVFVDGLMVVDLHQERRYFMSYLYIPADMVTYDSYIEIEIFPTYSFKEDIMFESMDDEVDVSIVEPTDNIWPTSADIYYQNTSYGTRYDSLHFDITSIYDRGEFLVGSDDPDKPVRFTRLNTFKIKPNDESVIGIPITATFSKCPLGEQFVIEKAGYVCLDFVEHGFNFNTDYMRIFRNGRLLPKDKYRFFSSFTHPLLVLLDVYDVGEIIYIDITPYRYTEIYHQEDLSPDNNLIDLSEIINKPFDIRYYDVYLNGRKLSLNNVFSITPTQITLVNIKSNYDLVIYERERDWEYFGLDYSQKIYYFSKDDFLDESYLTEYDKQKMIKEIIDETKDKRLTIYPNTNDEERFDDGLDNTGFVEYTVFYYGELIPKHFVNPDCLQFSEKLLSEEYPTILDTYRRSSYEDAINSYCKEMCDGMPDVICLDPDIIASGDSESVSLQVFMVGHPTDVDDATLNERIEINDDSDIEKERS